MPKRAWCPGSQWATLTRDRARCSDCGRELQLVGRDFMRGWGRTRLPNHVVTDPSPAGANPTAEQRDIGPVAIANDEASAFAGEAPVREREPR